MLGGTDATEGAAGLFVVAVLLNVPTGRLWDEENLGEDDDGYHHLENDDHLPVPLAEFLRVLGGTEGDPVCNKRANGIEHLPEGHDLSTDLRRSKLSDINRTSSKSETLSYTDEDTTSDEDTDLSTRSECLHNGSDDDTDGPSSHTDSSSSEISKRTSLYKAKLAKRCGFIGSIEDETYHEETSYNSTNSI